MEEGAAEGAGPSLVERLDDDCLLHVAALTDSAHDLVLLGASCRRLRLVVAGAEPVWQRRIAQDFGLWVQGRRLCAQYDLLRRAAGGEPGAGAGGPGGPTAAGQGPLPAVAAAAAAAALSEQGSGCADGPIPSPQAASGPPGMAARGAACSGAPGAAAGLRPFLPFVGVTTDGGCDAPWGDFWVGHLFSPSCRTFYSSEARTRNIHALALLQPRGPSDPADVHRTFLLERLQHPAAYLDRDVMRAIMTDQAWESGAAGEGGAGGPPAAPDPLPPAPPEAVAAARAALDMCDTKVLEDLYMHAFNALSQDRSWGRALAAGLSAGEAEHAIHHKAWQIWHSQRSSQYPIAQADPAARPLLLYCEAPLGRLLGRRAGGEAEGAVEAVEAGEGGSSSGGEEAGGTVALFDSVLINRHHNVTCPLACGALLAVTLGPADGRRPAPVGPAPFRAAQLAANLSSGLAGAEALQALSDATDVRAVMASVACDALPPVTGYYTNGMCEWLEFGRPTGQAAVLELPGCGGLRARVAPVVWFRFYTGDERRALRGGGRWAGGGGLPLMLVANQHIPAGEVVGVFPAAGMVPVQAPAPAGAAAQVPGPEHGPAAVGVAAAQGAGPAAQGVAAAAGAAGPEHGLAAAMAAALAGVGAGQAPQVALGAGGQLQVHLGGQQLYPPPQQVEGPVQPGAQVEGQGQAGQAGQAAGPVFAAGLAPEPGSSSDRDDDEDGSDDGPPSLVDDEESNHGLPEWPPEVQPPPPQPPQLQQPLLPVVGGAAGVGPILPPAWVNQHGEDVEGAGAAAGIDADWAPQLMDMPGLVDAPQPQPLWLLPAAQAGGQVGGNDDEEGPPELVESDEEEGGGNIAVNNAPVPGFAVHGAGEEEDEDGFLAMMMDDDIELGPWLGAGLGVAGPRSEVAGQMAAAAVAAAAALPPTAGLPALQAVVPLAHPTCPVSPNLTGLAPGVGYMYGWAAPPATGEDMVAIRLQRPFTATALLAKLIACEDMRPAFNRSRGGCNIDAGIIAVQGPASPQPDGSSQLPLVSLLPGIQLG